MAGAATTAQGRFQQLQSQRSPYLRRAQDCAKLTIPSLLPPTGAGGSMDLPTPFQAMGARGVNNLASKLLLSLLPPNQAFFRLTLDDYAIQQLTGSPEMRTEVETSLGQIERTVQTEIETTSTRPACFEIYKQLIVAGNVLVYIQPEGGLKVYRMDRYVLKRDPSGNLLEVVVHERVSPEVLPKSVREKAVAAPGAADECVDLYTWVRRKGDKFSVIQEVGGEPVPGSRGSWPMDKAPFMALRWTKVDGEDYGRSHVEEYLGDLRSLEGLTKAIVEGSAAAARLLVLVNPNGVTDMKTVSDAPNCAVRSGNAADVTTVQADKYADFRVALETINGLQQRLSQAFLLTASVQRQAERVTAEEIRLMAGELEDALGGVYSIQSQEFQLPLVRRLMFDLAQKGRLPNLPDDLVKPSIVTGMEALGRGHDLNRLLTFGQTVTQLLGPGAMAQYVKPPKVIGRVAVSLGLDTSDLVKSDAELAQEQKQAQQQAMMEKLGPEVLKNQQQPPDQEGGQDGPA